MHKVRYFVSKMSGKKWVLCSQYVLYIGIISPISLLLQFWNFLRHSSEPVKKLLVFGCLSLNCNNRLERYLYISSIYLWNRLGNKHDGYQCARCKLRVTCSHFSVFWGFCCDWGQPSNALCARTWWWSSSFRKPTISDICWVGSRQYCICCNHREQVRAASTLVMSTCLACSIAVDKQWAQWLNCNNLQIEKSTF